ncbi:haloalkane dehalogenase-like [Homarus americanus]|uniref:Haloalkane dehalogenase-like 1 n=1 Tax=Homarus americanus TaxID=6706 RepID=A0A8J5N997_HOMAM|nr:haloalkane dehalogenase-like [Homarus americanus]XP_042210820.1 haloalkane dehalogenase-like [Homarus americanus]KAG7175213.1 Haloalkane dehalogenase-like 1 [Homarus americanus]
MKWCVLLTVVLLGYARGSYVIVKDIGVPVLRTPDSRFSHLAQLGYPWAPKYLYLKMSGLTSSLRVHYIDEGPHDAKETLLLLHGVPSWSFLYRTMIPVFLAAGYRVVAVDQIGFGRSDKLTDPNDYSHTLQTSTVELVVSSLNLQGVTVVMQDLGGPTGMSAVIRDPGRYRRLVFINTLIPQGDILDSIFSVKSYSPMLLWRALNTVVGRNVPVGGVFKIASDAPEDAIIGGYVAPFPSNLYKVGASWWPNVIPLVEDDPVAIEMQKVAAFLKQWKNPVLLGYSDREVFTIPGRTALKRILPGACEVTIPDAGHYLQEDQGPAVAKMIVSFIKQDCGPDLHHLQPSNFGLAGLLAFG